MPFHMSRSQLIFLALLSSIGIGGSWLTYRSAVDEERDAIRARFVEQAQVQAYRAQQLIDEARQVQQAFTAFLDGSEEVSRKEYERFAHTLLPERQEIFAVHWAPRIVQAERAECEAELAARGLAPLGIFDVNPEANSPRRAAERPVYFPIVFSEPLAPNRSAVGLDTLARPYNEVSPHVAARFGMPHTTPAFPIVQDPGGPLAVAIYHPVYAHTQKVLDATDRLAALRGYVILMLRPEILLAERLGNLQGGRLAMRLLDVTDDTPRVIYPRGDQRWTAAGPVQMVALAIPGRQWRLELAENSSHAGSSTPLLLLFSLLALTCVVLGALARSFTQAKALADANAILRRQHEALDRLAHSDSLTGLPNRLRLQDRAEMALANETRQGELTAVCLLDLDNFKRINDTLGHQAGDQLLVKIAGVLSQSLRKGDTVARLGGDEFVLLLPHVNGADELPALLNRLLAEVDGLSVENTGGAVTFSASIGVALSGPACRDFGELLQRADQAMYHAKNLGKNRYVVWSGDEIAM